MILSLVRLFAFLAVLGGIVALGIQLGGGDDRDDDGAHAAAPLAPSPPAASSARLTEEEGWLVVRYALIAGDALVIRFSDDDMESCAFVVLTGPRDGVERGKAGIAVDYQVVPAAEWEQAVRRLARSCDEYWTSTR